MKRRTFLSVAAVAGGAATLSLDPSRAHGAETGLPAGYQPPPLPGGSWDDLGIPIASLTIIKGAFGHLADGRFVAYGAPLGENAEVNVSTLETQGVQVDRQPMAGALGSHSAVAVGPKCYFATYGKGELWVWDSTTQTLTNLGQPVAGVTYLLGLSAAPDGTVYGGTYPQAKLWSHHPDRGFRDHGRVTPDTAVNYSFSTAVDEARAAVFVGTSPKGQLVRHDLASGGFTPVSLRGTGASVTDLTLAAGAAGSRLFVQRDNKLQVIDASSLQEVPFSCDEPSLDPLDFAISGRGTSEARAGKVYLGVRVADVDRLAVYDLATDSVHVTEHVVPGALITFGWTTEGGVDVLYAMAGNYEGKAIRFVPSSASVEVLDLAFTPVPVPLAHVLTSSDGTQAYCSAYLNGNTARVDVATGESFPTSRLGQVESWVTDGGKVYAGAYPYATLMAWDAAAGDQSPVTTWANLKVEAKQARPVEAVVHGGRVWFGTQPDQGLNGGVLAVVDPASGGHEVVRDLVPGQSIASLAFLDERLLVGSSREGGNGAVPATGSAELLELDPATRAVLKRTTPIAGAMSINALCVGPQGHLYALVDTILLELDADLRERRRLQLLPARTTNAWDGALAFHPNGYLYVNTNYSLVCVDPFAFVAQVLAQSTSHRLSLARDGRIYTLTRQPGEANFVHLGRYTTSTMTTADAREFVTVAGTVTPVRNRFVATGVTLQDALPTVPEGSKSLAGTVNPWLDRQLAAGTITAAERELLWRAWRR